MQDNRSWAQFALEKVVWEGRQAAGRFLESIACEQARRRHDGKGTGMGG